MYTLLIKQFFRSKTVFLVLGISIFLGTLSIGTGKQFLNQKQIAIEKTIEQQEKHLITQVDLHKDDIGLLLYYLKFSFINSLKPIAGLAIGQSDVNSHIQNVSILNLEGQKYDTDLVNPMRLQVGNLDFSFLMICLFPLIVIALNFNLLSEEEEKGTWKMVRIQERSLFKYLLLKLSIRFLFVSLILIFLILASKVFLRISVDLDFWYITIISFTYIIFWFLVSFFVVLLRKSSNTNAIVLLTLWLVLVVLLPVMTNNYITNKYPVKEAFTMIIKQRDGYHKKWDTDKRATMEKFYNHYPQFKKYGVKENGFSWLWYYAMQQMGDDESILERGLLNDKIKKREDLGKSIARFFPPLQVQLTMNSIAKTSLADQMNFLKATSSFHERLRLDFYPKVFDNVKVSDVDWKSYKPEYFNNAQRENVFNSILPILFIMLILSGACIFIGVQKI
ncbi:DUF3526 domain-containing protein [Tenacibaculum sp. MAR_2009_124]|uniref:DUF3526 domain-containing protein n=1 Tax=Tenacibaculum sp. MAR_2009_124 TaxID=1250059 RepID=UPI000A85E28F|nr:DUF3526 domain-containing protein [Tenacibaculum sp. MAR_2009_124]